MTTHRFIDGEDRLQQALPPHSLEDYVSEENPVRVIEVFIAERDLAALGFAGMTPLKSRCTPTKLRRIKRWVNEDMLDRMQDRLDRMPQAMGVRRQTVEHPFGTLKAWMGATYFLTRTLDKVRTEMSLHVLAYKIKRVIAIIGVGPLMAAVRT